MTVMEPFPELSSRPTVVHVRTHVFSDRIAPFIRQTVLGLRPYFNNVVVVPDVDCENPPDVGVEVVRIADLRNPLTCLQLAAYLREKYPSIGAVMGHMGNGTRASTLLAETLGVPLLGTFGGSDVNIEFDKPDFRAIYDQIFAQPSAHFLTVAGYLREKLLAYGAPRDRLFTWHRGVNLEHFEVTERPTTARTRLVVSARFYEVKGHEYVIRALSILKKQGRRAELVLLGDGPLQERMKELAGELGVAEDVRFVGHVTHAEVMQHLAQAHVLVHPSVTCAEGRIEGIPNAIMEAHATGLPVVATDHGGISEVVLDGETGFQVPERDPEALAQRIGQLIDSRELRTRMGLRGRTHIEREFDLTVQSRRLAARLHHTMLAGELFDVRGWPKHRRRVEATAQPTPAKPVAVARGQLLEKLVNPHFVSKRRFVGPIIVGYKKAIWTAVFRPYLRLLDREITTFVGKELSRQLAGMNVTASPAQRRLPVVPAATQLTMSSAACPDCPHCAAGAPWPAEPCPLDARCFETLQREFATLAPPAPPATAAAGLTLTDVTIPTSGRLAHPDGAFASVELAANLQKVADIPGLFRELRRVLRADGELRLRLWPLPGGRDGGRLVGDVAIPFAQHVFSPAVIEAALGTVLRPRRRFDADDVRRWLAEAGFSPITVERLPGDQDPSEMHVQARFAPVLRGTGLLRAQLARAFVATYRAAAAAAAEPVGAAREAKRSV